ncbi:MAG TPA: hypothetical protein VE980_22955 [Pyrinomonadaceae bacterium]|nr:hypothetical protein [Pyrinomonadaceae bacterium]
MKHSEIQAGANDEARIYFNEALKRLTFGGNARANALIGLSFVEWAEAHYNEALKVLTDNAQTFERINNHTFKGAYHNQIGIILEEIGAASRKRSDYYFNAQSTNTASQMNISKPLRILSIALTSKTTSVTCCANSINSRKHMST